MKGMEIIKTDVNLLGIIFLEMNPCDIVVLTKKSVLATSIV